MLICAYVALLPKLGGYLTDAGRVHLPRAELVLREVAACEEEVFERRRRREEGQKRAAAARAVAEGGVADPNAFGKLYPPRDGMQQQLHTMMKAFADAGETGATLPLPTPLSGFHKASAVSDHGSNPGRGGERDLGRGMGRDMRRGLRWHGAVALWSGAWPEARGLRREA